MAVSCRNAAWLSFSLLGAIFGFAAFIVFLLPGQQNFHATVWGLYAGVCASLVFHLNYLHARGRLSLWHSFGTLNTIFDFGVVTSVLSSAAMAWYIFCTLYYKTPMLPVHQSTVIPAIWAFMTLKWAFSIIICVSKLNKYLLSLQYLRMATE